MDENATNKKRLNSQNKRLKSIEDLNNAQKKRRKLIARSLRSTDPSKEQSRRIVFNSDDDELENQSTPILERNMDFAEEEEQSNEQNATDTASHDSEFLNVACVDDSIPNPKVTDNQITPIFEMNPDFVKELKEKRRDDFSFLTSIGRKPPSTIDNTSCELKSLSIACTDDPASRLKIANKFSSISNSYLQKLKNVLESGVLSEADKSDPIFFVDVNEVQSVVSSFRPHNFNHLQQNWKKHRVAFIKSYKRCRKLAVKKSQK